MHNNSASRHYLVQRFVRLRGGSTVTSPVRTFSSQLEADEFVKRALDDEDAFEKARLVALQGSNAIDLGIGLTDYLNRFMLLEDTGYEVVPVPVGASVIVRA